MNSSMSIQSKRREKLQILINCGITCIEKLMAATGLCRRTIFKWKKKIKRKKPITRKPGTGRRRLLTPTNEQYVRRIGLINNRYTNQMLANKVLEAKSVKVSRFTIGRVLKRDNITRLAPNRVPLMTSVQQKRRLEWCIRYKNYNWEDVVFSDESIFEFNSKPPKLLCRKGQRKSIPMAKHPASTMIWGGISLRGRTQLATVKGIINSTVYCECLEGHLITIMEVLYPEGYTLQEDNATVHKSRETTAWKLQHGINTIVWPANSPDLNPIENVWGLMKHHLASINFKTVDSWRAKLHELWENFTAEYMRALIESRPRRIMQVIRNKGKVSNY